MRQRRTLWECVRGSTKRCSDEQRVSPSVRRRRCGDLQQQPVVVFVLLQQQQHKIAILLLFSYMLVLFAVVCAATTSYYANSHGVRCSGRRGETRWWIGDEKTLAHCFKQMNAVLFLVANCCCSCCCVNGQCSKKVPTMMQMCQCVVCVCVMFLRFGSNVTDVVFSGWCAAASFV